MNGLAPGDVGRFRAAIVQQIGLQFDDAKLAFLGDVLQRRLARLSSSSAPYLDKLETQPPRGELTALARELTVGETYFFRHNDQFRALAETVLPERMCVRKDSKALRILSAGCASGEEAYSLAIVAQETIADPSWTVSIRAIDLNPAVLEKAARGRYSAWALRDAPPDLQRKWFRADSRELVLQDAVRGAVQFDQGNLASDDPALWPSSAYDVIFCRNVLMYFAPAQMRAAIARLAAALAPDGYLFLGHAETLRGISDDFHLCHTHDTFYYQRKATLRTPAAPSDHGTAAKAPVVVPDTAWVDTIRQASERVAALLARPNGEHAASPPQPNTWELAPALDLLRHERFGEALDHLRGGPPDSGRDPDVLLVKAMVLTEAGQGDAAEQACHRLLEIDELNAGAHYVLALCRERAGERERAMEHDRVAAHLDPGFAMPRLHAGLLARHAGDRDGARRELAQALVLLKREDVSRLILFGGGFSRDALMALCRSAAEESGGRP